MKSIVVPANNANVNAVTAFVTEQLEAYDCPAAAQMQIEIAIEEIFVNISSYAYHPVEGEAEVRCEVLENPLRVVVQFLDGGKPYDPLARGETDISKEAILAHPGGLGIHMVRRMMDDVSYTYEDGKNILTILKKF